MKTIRLLYPDYVSGGLDTYYFGANLLAHILPENKNQPLIKVDIAQPNSANKIITDGIYAKGEVLSGIQNAMAKIEKENPDKIITIGGNCLVSLAPFDYLHGKYKNTGIVWIDAHPDVSSPKDGYPNAHAMVLGSLMGYGDNSLSNMMKNNKFNPDEILLVLDSMIGQDAINVINGFNDKLPLTGTILTKLDGDTKGGVALSARHLTNVPIKFIGTSEKLDGLEVFDPERMVNRILGMGDIMSLVEKVESVYTEEDEKDAEKTFKKMQKGKFDLEDFLAQFKQIKKLGSIEGLLKLIPGAKKMGLNNINIDPKDMARVEAIILSMTPEERRKPEIIKANRKIRIAKGSGTSVQEVNKLLTQFEQSKKMMKMFSNGSFKMPF